MAPCAAISATMAAIAAICRSRGPRSLMGGPRSGMARSRVAWGNRQRKLQIAKLHGAALDDRQPRRLQHCGDVVELHVAVAMVKMVEQPRVPMSGGAKVDDEHAA